MRKDFIKEIDLMISKLQVQVHSSVSENVEFDRVCV